MDETNNTDTALLADHFGCALSEVEDCLSDYASDFFDGDVEAAREHLLNNL